VHTNLAMQGYLYFDLKADTFYIHSALN